MFKEGFSPTTSADAAISAMESSGGFVGAPVFFAIRVLGGRHLSRGKGGRGFVREGGSKI
jgi:hypothetical protein